MPHIYLYRHTKEEGEEVHDGEAWKQLSLQKHGGVVVVTVLCCDIVLMWNIHLVVHDNHVDHHAHHRHTEKQAHQERFPPPSRAETGVRNWCILFCVLGFYAPVRIKLHGFSSVHQASTNKTHIYSTYCWTTSWPKVCTFVPACLNTKYYTLYSSKANTLPKLMKMVLSCKVEVIPETLYNSNTGKFYKSEAVRHVWLL